MLNNIHKKNKYINTLLLTILRCEFVLGRVVEEAEEKKEKLLGKNTKIYTFKPIFFLKQHLSHVVTIFMLNNADMSSFWEILLIDLGMFKIQI
jgi:hypothetical protein